MAFFEDNSISHNVESNTAFRAWASKIHEALEKVGLVNTADTGQINLATVERPGSLTTFAGYEIWRFNDAEQSERPIYIKIRYGIGAATTRPRLEMDVGRGSDGAGNLTNAAGGRVCTPTGTPAGFGFIHACLYKGSFHLLSCQNITTGGTTEENAAMWYTIERLKNASTGAFVNAVSFVGGGNNGSFEVPINTFFGGAWEEAADTFAAGGTLVQEEAFAPGFRQQLSPVTATASRAILGYRIGVMGAGDSGQLEIAGEKLTYKSTPVNKRFKLPSSVSGTGTREHQYLLLHQ